MTSPVSSENKFPSIPQPSSKPQLTFVQRIFGNFLSSQNEGCLTERDLKIFCYGKVTQLHETDQDRLMRDCMKGCRAYRDYNTWTRYNLRPY